MHRIIQMLNYSFRNLRTVMVILLVLSALLWYGCGHSYVEDDPIPVKRIIGLPYPEPGSLNFIVLGDWGQAGKYNQREVGIQMGNAAHRNNCSFIITTGDNFYYDGVTGIDDVRWLASFENIYSHPALMVPWYPSLGNHDILGNWQGQIDYSAVSGRWTMPDRYYTFEKELVDDTSVRFIILDTNQFIDEYYTNDIYKNGLSGVDRTVQLRWLEKKLGTSTADWNIVIGHHQIYSGSPNYGNNRNMLRDIDPILRSYNTDIYFCGHEHDLQHLKADGKTHYIISGAGSLVRPTGMGPNSLFSASISGFTLASVTKERIKFYFIDYEGNVIYRYIIERNREE
jgi:tartrate-resistant acid phosphatase type 5